MNKREFKKLDKYLKLLINNRKVELKEYSCEYIYSDRNPYLDIRIRDYSIFIDYYKNGIECLSIKINNPLLFMINYYNNLGVRIFSNNNHLSSKIKYLYRTIEINKIFDD